MPRFARLFEAADETLESFRDAMRRRDVDGVLRAWSDEDAISCILPDGQRLSSHAELRSAFALLFEQRAIFCEAIESVTQASLGLTIFDVVEAMRFDPNASEAELYVHTTYVLAQSHEGWRIIHLHSSPANTAQIGAPAHVVHALH